MHIKNITKHGFFKYYTLVILLFVIFEVIFSVFARNFFYKETESFLLMKSSDLENIFADYKVDSQEDFQNKITNYIKNFKANKLIDLVAFDSNGNKLVSLKDEIDLQYDKNHIKSKKKNTYFQNEKIKNGKHVIILTVCINDGFENLVGEVKYVFPLDKTDNLILNAILVSAFILMVLILLLILLNVLFIKSILTPINEVSKTSRKIALGDFKARLTTRYDGAVGELCDTVNFMAQKLDESEKMKNDFISSVSHELRTPLTAIKGWAETIQLGGEKDIEMNQRGLNIIVHECERLCGIVEELLDFSRMQSGRMILNLEKIDILAELSEAVYIFKERAFEEKKLLLYSEPELLPPVLGDKNRLRQVFINIIDNALKYTQENGVINVGAKEENGFINITISDNGFGIPQEHLPKVKEKFFKGNMTQKGSGIGLAVANEIILLHAGSLDIKSEVNIGTVVTISIPIVKSDN